MSGTSKNDVAQKGKLNLQGETKRINKLDPWWHGCTWLEETGDHTIPSDMKLPGDRKETFACEKVQA